MTIGRVSTYQVNKSFSTQLNNTQSKFNKLTQQISSGNRISSTIEDPVAARGIIKANAEISNIEEYSENIKQADIELSQIDSTLKSINDQLNRAYDLAMQVSNGTIGSDEIKAFQEEIDTIIDNVTRLSNTQYNDQYLFAGTRTTTTPYVVGTDGLKYAGNDEARYAITGENKTEQINLIGEDYFGNAEFTTDTTTGEITYTGGDGAFGALYELKASIQDGSNIDTDKLKASMGELSESMDKIISGQTKVGAVGATFDDMLDSYESDTTNLTELRSNLQDTDLSTAVSDWYSAYQSLQASYQMFSQTMNVSLLNYI